MPIAVIVSKPSQIADLLPHLCRLWPHETHFDVFPVYLRGFFRPAWVRGLRWKDYPHLSPWDSAESSFVWRDDEFFKPLVGRVEVARWHQLRSEILPDHRVPWGELGEWESSTSLYEERLKQATHVVAAMDPHPSSVFAAALLRRLFVPSTASWEAVELHSFAPASLDQAFANRDAAPAWFDQGVVYGETKAYFDHQFALNSLAILGRTFARPGQPQPWISKCQVQLLYAFGRTPPLTDARWIAHMREWRGTGKYRAADHPLVDGLGSITSRVTLLTQLRQHGWIEPAASHSVRLTLSEAGQQAIAALHPKCEDPDVLFRLDGWCQQGLSVSRPSMDHYLKTFFGRQKRFLDRSSTGTKD